MLQIPTDGSIPLVASHDHVVPQPLDSPDAKQSLVALLPSAQDAVTIVTNTTAWLWGAENPPGSILTSSDRFQLLEIAAIAKSSAICVAQALLLFALYMQQLPANFDAYFLGSQSVERVIERIVERVKVFVLSHEEKVDSLDDIECLTLLSLIQLNDGAIRQAWMTFRRALDVCRLNGLHNSFSLFARNSSCSDMALRRRLWLSIVCGDCYCSLLLGLEPVVGIAPFGPDDETWHDPVADDEANVQRRLCLIVARIAQRNAVGLHQDRHILTEIDQALKRLQESVSPSWWKAPSFRQDRPVNSAQEPNRLTFQLWFFQAQIFAHMPIAFAAITNDSLNSLGSCMEASRIPLHRFIGLRHAKDHLSRCRAIDQSVFIAAMVLLLAQVQLRPYKMHSTAFRYDSDRALIEQVVDIFENVGKMCHREHVARHSSQILSAMLEIVTADSEDTFFTATSGANTLEAKSWMEDIIVSSILPALDVQSPASRLINLLFASKRSTLVVAHNQEVSTKNDLDSFIDPTTLQYDDA